MSPSLRGIKGEEKSGGRIKTIPYGCQHITEEDIAAVVDVLKSDYLTQGPKVGEFEEAFASYVGAKYAVAVASGTAALHLSNLVMGIQHGQKVLTTPITFAATANSALYCGGEVDFIDIDPDTYLMDLDKLEDKLAASPKGAYAGVIAVDFAGLPVDTERLREIADKYELWIIEDACHAPGGYFIDSKNRKIKCGSNVYTDLTCFSFHPVKHIACGEGGMITTNDENLYHRLLNLRTHGISKENMQQNDGGWYYEMQELGFNYRLPDINAALGNSQLKNAEERLQRRKEIATNYDRAFHSFDKIKVQSVPRDVSHAYHLYVIRVADRKDLYNHLHHKGIYAQVHYVPIHILPYYKKRYGAQSFPKADVYYYECMSLPMYPTISEEEQKYIINQVLSFYTY